MPFLDASLEGWVGAMRISAHLQTGDGPLVLVGPNGAGKSSLLRMLLGAIPATGRIVVGETILLDSVAGVDVPLEQRRLGYVPQDYGLFPHLSVRENVRFAARSAVSRASRSERDQRVDARLSELGLEALAERSVRTLSGGERQRLALARALAAEPRALLLDEPLAALDLHARRDIRAFLAGYLRRLGLPALVITHDPADARALGGPLVVLEHGQMVQSGSWAELEAAPASPFVEAFTGR